MNLSKSQKDIINLINGDVLVSASAGSGKTTVLVKRILNLILNFNVSIDEILVITFTNMASAEMKERIVYSLEDIYNEDNKEILERELFLVHNAHIETFHSFCLDIIKNYYYILNLNSELSIIRDSERNALIAEALEETFNNYYEKGHEGFINLVNMYGGKYYDDSLKTIILDIYSYIVNLPNRDEFIKNSIDSYDKEIINLKAFKIFKDIYIKDMSYIKDDLKDLMIMHRENEDLKWFIDFDISLIDSIINKLNDSYEGAYDFIHEIKFKSITKKVNIEEYKEIRDKLKKIISDMKDKVFTHDKKSLECIMKDLKIIVKDLFLITLDFSKRFKDKKLRKNLIDFNDIENMAIELLENEDIRSFYKDKFKYIFIDEYQDTNYIQEYIIGKIKRDNNLFMVGDVKQSIYGFRGARPEIFYNKYKSFKYIDEKSSETKILLYDNYRSSERIISFINLIFKSIMVNKVSNIEYGKEEYLNFMGDLKEGFDDDITLSLFYDENMDFKDECEGVVSYIKEVLNKEIYEDGVLRKVDYKDIVILMRNINSSSKASMLYNTLVSNDIPVYFDGGEKFFDSVDVMVILGILKIINNPLDDLEILTVMKSSIFDFTSDDIASLRLINEEEYLYNNMKNFNTPFIKEDYVLDKSYFDSLKYKCERFLNKINLYKEKSLLCELDDLIWFIYIDSGYYFDSLDMDVRRKQNNLRLIFNKAKEFKSKVGSSLFNFIEYLNNSKRFGDDLSPKDIKDSENLVRIMSIHKSKGLEFPIVILCNTSSNFNFKDLNNPVQIHESIGLGINHIDYENFLETDIIIKEGIKKINKKDRVSEEIRLLYVALTRAKNKLLITGTYSKEDYISSLNDITKFKSFLQFIVFSLKDSLDFNIKENLINHEGVLVKVNVFNYGNKVYSEEIDTYNKTYLKELINKGEDTKDLEEIFKFKYDYDTNIRSNFSVSEIINYEESSDLNVSIKYPKFLDKDNKRIYSPRDIGNLYHLFMQKVNLKGDITLDYLEKECTRMVNSNILNHEDLNHINLNKVLNFFNSPIGKRMINSYVRDHKNVYREFEFLMYHRVHEISPLEDIRIQGIADLFFFEEDFIVLIDYKTNKSGFSLYNDQLKYYSIALEKIFKKKVKEKYIYSFTYDKFI